MRAARFAIFGLAMSVFLIDIASATPSFEVRTPLTVPRHLGSLAVGDVNNDGIDDIAVVGRVNNKVSLILVDADGNYRQGTSLTLGTRLRNVGIGDFNGDGNGDLVVTTGTRNTFIIPGNGDGTFGAFKRLRRCCAGEGIIVGDFDNSRPGAKLGDDFVVTNKRDISVVLNRNLTGAMEFNTERRIRVGKKPRFLAVNDFNKDGYLDIGVVNTFGAGNDVSILINTGQANPGAFRLIANFFAGRRARSIAIGDLTLDGEADIVTGDQRNVRVSVLPALGGGFFGTTSAVDIGCTREDTNTVVSCLLRSVRITDFDLDGNNDVAVLMGSNLNTLRFFRGDPASGLTKQLVIPGLGSDARFMQVGKFNNDDLPDLVVGSRRDTAIRLLINTSSGIPVQTATFTPTGPTPTGPAPTATRTPTPPVDCRGQGCACEIDDDCNSPFFCATADGVCCDTPCDIENVSCSLPGSVGTCKPIDLLNGEECMSNEQCRSNFCVEGFCCNTVCDGEFDHCNLNPPGQCMTNTTPNRTPTRTRTPTPTTRLKELGEDCGSGSECRSTFCPSEDLVCCESACNGTNEQCDLPSQEGQCLPINLPDNEACVVDQQCISRVCDGGLCRGLPTRTPTTPGAPTFTQTPQKGPTGAICTDGDQCDSGFCPEGDDVCCNEPCDGPNERCDLPGKEGICLDIDVDDGGPCELDSQCLSRICDGNICRSAQSRTPTPTRTATPNRQPTLIIARGSGCTVGSSEGSFGSLALLLGFPAAWWFLVRRVPAPVRRRPRRR